MFNILKILIEIKIFMEKEGGIGVAIKNGDRQVTG